MPMPNSDGNHDFIPLPPNRHSMTLLTDIEKIQSEIAKDLSAAYTFDDTYYESMTDMVPPTADTFIPAATPNDSIDMTGTASSFDSNPDYVPGSFYRETIKDSGRRRSWGRVVAVVILVCIFGMGSLGFGLGAAYARFTGRTGEALPLEAELFDNAPTITSNRYVFELGDQEPGTVADMVELLESAVVSITTIFEAPYHAPIAGTGTIFADNEDRIFIVTGNYVVPSYQGTQYLVRIAGSQPLQARFVNNNRDKGLAVISIDKAQLIAAGIESFTIADFGDSSLMQVGDVVFAMGNARNEGISVTRGIVSAGKQELEFPGYTLTVLQTDAAINHGSSGGPLINLRGEVIGINIDRATMMFNNASVEGIGYSIASNVVMPILDDLICPNRPGLGIMGRTVNDEIAADFGGIPAMGVLVVNVIPGGAAYTAGILPNDIITAFAGEPVFVMDELLYMIRQRRIGDIVEINILRGGTTPMTIEVEFKAFIQ